jgi:hypothetical protein
MRIPALLVLTIGVLFAADAPKKDAPKVEGNLWAAISVNRPIIDGEMMSQDPFMIHFGLVNDGDKAVDPEIESSQLFVNGKELKDWSFIIGNGPRDDRWKALPPGDHLSFGYALGKHFEKPGAYRVSWKGKNFESPEIVFRVKSSKGK